MSTRALTWDQTAAIISDESCCVCNDDLVTVVASGRHIMNCPHCNIIACSACDVDFHNQQIVRLWRRYMGNQHTIKQSALVKCPAMCVLGYVHPTAEGGARVDASNTPIYVTRRTMSRCIALEKLITRLYQAYGSPPVDAEIAAAARRLDFDKPSAIRAVVLNEDRLEARASMIANGIAVDPNAPLGIAEDRYRSSRRAAAIDLNDDPPVLRPAAADDAAARRRRRMAANAGLPIVNLDDWEAVQRRDAESRRVAELSLAAARSQSIRDNHHVHDLEDYEGM